LADVIVNDLEEHQQDINNMMINGRCEDYAQYRDMAAQIKAFEVAKNIVKERFKEAEEAE
jgi:hypothetical protein